MTVTRKITLALVAGLVCAVAVIGFNFWHQGYRVYVIHTGSMVPTLPMGAAVIDKQAPAYSGLEPGEIITFRHSGLSTDVVTHRVVSLNGGTIQTKGDANLSADTWDIRPDQVEGAEAFTIPKLGYLLVFLKQPAGVASAVTTVFAMFLLWGLFFPAAASNVVRRIPAHRRSRHQLKNAAIPPRVLGHEEIDPITESPPIVAAHRHRAGRLAVSSGASRLNYEVESFDILALHDLLEHASAAG